MASRWVEDAKHPKKISLKDHAVRGKADAPVTLVVYSDFTCGYCEQASKVIAALQKEKPDVFRYVFKPRPAKNPAAQSAAGWFTHKLLQIAGKSLIVYGIVDFPVTGEKSRISEHGVGSVE